jgi:transposase InsO family protein
LPDTAGDKPEKKRFKSYPIGYFHVDIAEVQTEQGKLYPFVAIDRTSKYAYAELLEKATRMTARDFLTRLIAVVPYAIHTILTDNGIQFAKREGTEAYWTIPFDRIYLAHGIEHRLIQVCHPWTNGQVERMSRTIKEATVHRYHYGAHDQSYTTGKAGGLIL